MQTPVIKRLGAVAFEPTWRAMQAANKSRTPSTPDEIWLLEHPPIFTLGLAGKPEHLLAPGKIEVIKIDRGGQVTYHGPGQLVIYLMLDLSRLGFGVKELVKRIEQSVIDFLAEYGIESYRKKTMPGVYVRFPSLAQPRKSSFASLPPRGGGFCRGFATHALRLQNGQLIHPLARPARTEGAYVDVNFPSLVQPRKSSFASLPPRGGGTEGEGASGNHPTDAKIAAIGLRVANHATFHGLSLNIDMDLEPFSRINPCGYEGLAVTQMRDCMAEFGNEDKMPAFAQIGDKLVAHLSQQLYGKHHG